MTPSVFIIKSPKKLIEVALPLDEINEHAASEKTIRHGHPSSLHLWWARRPLAAARAVIFAQFVNDPSWKWELEHPGKIPPNHLKASWAASRKHLFALLAELVKWKNTTDEALLNKAHAEIKKSWREVCELNQDHPDAASLFDPDVLPGFHDPFAGGGAIPLEAQRLGLTVFASDLNQVAVLLNKAMLEIPPRFSGRAPVHPVARAAADLKVWRGCEGLAEDVRQFGRWIREQAEQRIGQLYPKVKITAAMTEARPDLQGLLGKDLQVIAWLWARTVRSPSPAFSHVQVPLVSSFILSAKAGKDAWVEPVVEEGSYRFAIRRGAPPTAAQDGTKASGRGAEFRCLLSGAPIDGNYIKAEAQAGRMGARLLAIVAEGARGRVYLDPLPEHARAAETANPPWKPDGEFFQQALGFRIGNYGMSRWSDLFTPRQLVALNCLADLIQEARAAATTAATAAGLADDGVSLELGGRGATAYGDAVSVYLAFALDKQADLGNSLCRWEPIAQCPRQLFGRQAIPMVWDFAEGNPLGSSSGSWHVCIEGIAKAFADSFGTVSGHEGRVTQADASKQQISAAKVVSCDPPYYDNIGYADLSEFFYVWLRRSLRPTFPALFAAISTPKMDELVATPDRHGGKAEAEKFFLSGMTAAMKQLAHQAHPAFPITIFYAFKQAETKQGVGTSSTGWETFLDAVLSAGLAITGTWPMRTENSSRLRGQSSNALASSVVLVCRRRPESASTVSRREFLRELNAVLPESLDEMTRGAGEERSPVAPVDLSQAMIGPGMAVFSKYQAVLEADGRPMRVKTALQLINRFLAEDDFDADTQFCLHWLDQYGWVDGPYGEADVLARAKATSVGGLEQAGVIHSGRGEVRLRRWSDYPADWDPRTDTRLPVWEGLHQLIHAFRRSGEDTAGRVLGALRGKIEAIRQLAYRLYTLCERRGWAEDARAYNELMTSWTAIETIANSTPEAAVQTDLPGVDP